VGSMLKRFKICDGRPVETDEDGQILVYIKPTDEDKKYLTDDLKLDEHTLNSALDPDELSRLEFEPDHMALIFKRPRVHNEKDHYLFRVFSIGLFLFKDKIIILEADETPLFEGKLFSKIQSLPEIAVKLLFRSVFRFIENLRTINTMSGQLEQKINTSMQNKYIIDMFTLEKSLVYYLNAINSNSTVIEKLKMNSKKVEFTPENDELLEDLIIENTQCYRQAKIYSDILSGMMDAWASVVSNNLNIVMKTLTIITVAIMLPTLVVSAFSMNVAVPLMSDNPNSFWMIIALAMVSVAIVMFIRWYKKW
jgi:magnesium transporter